MSGKHAHKRALFLETLEPWEPRLQGMVLTEYLSSKNRYQVGTLNLNDSSSIQTTGFFKKADVLLIEVCVLGVGCWGENESHTSVII